MTNNSILSSYNFYVGQKDPIKVPILTLSNALVKICQIPHVIFQTTSQFSFKFCITLQCHERYLLCNFLAQTICTLLKRSPLKRKFLRLSSSQVKICQIPYVSFDKTCRLLSKFCIPLEFHER